MTLSLLCVLRKNQKSPQLIFDTHLPFSKLRSFVTCVSDRTKPHSGKCPHLIFQKICFWQRSFKWIFRQTILIRGFFLQNLKCVSVYFIVRCPILERGKVFPRSFFQDLSNRQCTCNGLAIEKLYVCEAKLFTNNSQKFNNKVSKVSWSLFRACSFGLSTGSGLMLRSLS